MRLMDFKVPPNTEGIKMLEMEKKMAKREISVIFTEGNYRASGELRRKMEGG